MGYQMEKVIIVIPCYNEEMRLPVNEMREFFEKNSISCILVNDGSSDGSEKVIDDLSGSVENINALHLAENVGKAEAVRLGVLSALDNSPEYVGYWDADMATPLKELNLFMACFEQGCYEAVTGCRLARLGARVKRKSSRHYLGRVFATAVSILLKLQVYDTQCGAKIFKSELARQIFDRPFKSKWLFDVEILKRIVDVYGTEKTQDDIVYEVPVVHWQDVGGSKLTFSMMLQVPFQLMKIFMSK
jgi:dolichyl-phosphate beta-glucosyltransferase